MEEDEVYKEMVLNLRARDDSAPVIKLNPPYDLMVDLSKIVSGRQTMTSIEPILEALHHLLLNYDNIKQKLKRINTLVNDFAYSERASEMSFLL